ncbi:MAG: hypothetical protein KAT39_15315, partial [Alphaproteobacteria bacterium]|nr:hypothetical protein [Alphaproteobacteria bacterium]
MADRIFRDLTRSAVIVALLGLAGCMQVDDVASGLLENLRGKLSANYDPPDYKGPPLGDLPSYRRGDAS